MMERGEAIAAKVVSAVKLKDEQLAALENLLSSKLSRDVALVAEIDPSLIGGFHIYVDGLIIDRTVKKQLMDMRESIMKGVI